MHLLEQKRLALVTKSAFLLGQYDSGEIWQWGTDINLQKYLVNHQVSAKDERQKINTHFLGRFKEASNWVTVSFPILARKPMLYFPKMSSHLYCLFFQPKYLCEEQRGLPLWKGWCGGNICMSREKKWIISPGRIYLMVKLLEHNSTYFASFYQQRGRELCTKLHGLREGNVQS